jgi:hypothetical protein
VDMVVSRIDSGQDSYYNRSSTARGRQPSTEEVGDSGQPSNDKPQSARDAGRNTAEKGQGPSLARNQSNSTDSQSAEVLKLKKRDTEVRAHEQAHIAAGGQYVRGGAKYQYTTGPDGQKYAAGGEVSIDTSPVRDDPRGTIQKMQTVKRAALAPSQPSAQDQAVAATADRTASQAQMELMREPAKAWKGLTADHSSAKGTKIDAIA